jgi:L-iditol 2-dehydrogenase
MMLAAIYQSNKGLQLRQREVPKLQSGEVLLKVEACGICGTDLRIQASGHRSIPEGQARILGHEIAGIIVDVGADVQAFEQGMRVAIAPNMGCGHCETCTLGYTQLCPDFTSFGAGLDGGFAEFMVLPSSSLKQGNIFPISDTLHFEEAALLEPLSCCYHGLAACQPQPGETILVYGAGPIGLMHLQLAQTFGASRIFCATAYPERLEQFPISPTDHILNPAHAEFENQLLELNHDKGVDVIIVATGSKAAQAQAIRIADIHGRINFFSGLPKHDPIVEFDSNLIHYKELVVTGTTGQTLVDYRACLSLVEAGRINVKDLVTHRYPLSEIDAALKTARDRSGLKVMILPHQGS